MSENLTQPGSVDPFEQARKLADELGRAGDPVVEYPEALPERPGPDAGNKEKKAYKRDELRLREASGAAWGKGTEFEGRLEAGMVMADMAPFLRDQDAIAYARENKKEDPIEARKQRERLKKLVLSSSEYQFLVTHFVLENSNKREYLEEFWEAAKTIGEKTRGKESVQKLRMNVLTTVATLKALDQLGYDPELSHPTQDVLDAVDVWTGDHERAVQVKTAMRRLDVYRTEDVAYPAARIEREGSPVRMVSAMPADTASELAKFRTRVLQLSEREHRPVEGIYVRMPLAGIDVVTGDPDPQLVEELGRRLEAA